jgi:dTMP kinase
VFVTFEGPEGSGKSTQSQRLAKWLVDHGLTVVVTYEPGGTALGEAIRRLVLEPNQHRRVGARAEALLFAAARAQLVDEVIRPALRRGDVVICDRFGDSSIAYQGGGRGLAVMAIESLVVFATEGLEPDLTILLDLDVSIGLRRKKGAARDRLESEDRTFHERVRRAYLARAASLPDRVVVLDATRDADDLSDEIRRQISTLLARRARGERIASSQ